MPSSLIFRGGRLQPRVPRSVAHEFAEADHRHGSGTIRLRLVRVDWAHVVAHDGERWLEVEGVVIDSAGREGDRRQVLIRAERLTEPPARKRTRLRV
jgi:hypothetical protein